MSIPHSASSYVYKLPTRRLLPPTRPNWYAGERGKQSVFRVLKYCRSLWREDCGVESRTQRAKQKVGKTRKSGENRKWDAGEKVYNKESERMGATTMEECREIHRINLVQLERKRVKKMRG
jgi:hypothetical protein